MFRVPDDFFKGAVDERRTGDDGNISIVKDFFVFPGRVDHDTGRPVRDHVADNRCPECLRRPLVGDVQFAAPSRITLHQPAVPDDDHRIVVFYHVLDIESHRKSLRDEHVIGDKRLGDCIERSKSNGTPADTGIVKARGCNLEEGSPDKRSQKIQVLHGFFGAIEWVVVHKTHGNPRAPAGPDHSIPARVETEVPHRRFRQVEPPVFGEEFYVRLFKNCCGSIVYHCPDL